LLTVVALALPHASALRAQARTEGDPAAMRPKEGEPTTAQSTAPQRAYSLDDTGSLAAFVDGVMKAHMEEHHIPAAVIAVVKDGRMLYSQGYGNANIAKATPIVPATSLFRIGSVSKLFTWTAVMQLVEQGKLDLDADVNKYIKGFQIESAFGKPVTLRHLLTHSAGFEDGGLGYLITNDSTQTITIQQALARHQPKRVRPPGELSSYSNYGAALAGLIVEQVSGVPFNEYVRRYILEPLDMRYTTFQEPLPPELRPYAVTGYARKNGDFVAKPFEMVGGFRPAGSVSASAVDMTHFMIAHLQEGRYGDARILKPETARLMHEASFANDPRLPAMALGFYEQRLNDQRVVGHAGDTQLFHSEMFLVPEKQVGIFVSYVGDGGGPARAGMMRALFDRYFPASPATVAAAPTDFATSAQKYAGAYRIARHSSTKFEKAILLASGPINVSVLPKERRLLLTGIGSEPVQFQPIGNGVFQAVGGHQKIAFTEDGNGRVSRVSIDELPFMGTEPAPWYETPSLWYVVLGVSALLFLSVFLSVVYRRKESKGMEPALRRTVWLGLATSAWFFLTFIVIGAVIAANSDTLFAEIPQSLKVAMVLPLVFVVLTLLVMLAAVQLWRGRHWTTGRRLHFTAVAVAAVLVCLFFNQFNMLGWRFG
jgi:CubicO group peptidase (beta-lactamase class C family)